MCFNNLQFFTKSLPSKIHQESSIHPYTQIYLKLTLLFPTNQKHMYFFPKPHLWYAFIVWCLSCKSHSWKISHILGGGAALLEWKSWGIGPYISLVPFMENRFFSLIIYPDYTFLSIHSSQFFPTSSQIQIHPLFCLWLENKQASQDNNNNNIKDKTTRKKRVQERHKNIGPLIIQSKIP